MVHNSFYQQTASITLKTLPVASPAFSCESKTRSPARNKKSEKNVR